MRHDISNIIEQRRLSKNANDDTKKWVKEVPKGNKRNEN